MLKILLFIIFLAVVGGGANGIFKDSAVANEGIINPTGLTGPGGLAGLIAEENQNGLAGIIAEENPGGLSGLLSSEDGIVGELSNNSQENYPVQQAQGNIFRQDRTSSNVYYHQ